MPPRAQPRVEIVHVTSLAGTFTPEKKVLDGFVGGNAVVAIVAHEKTPGAHAGCGALDSLTSSKPAALAENLCHVWHGLAEHGVNPEKYFGITLEKLGKIVKGVQLETHAHERAPNLFAIATATLPTVAFVHAHEDGVLQVRGKHGLEELDLERPIKVIACVCADARSDARTAVKGVEALLNDERTTHVALPEELIALNPATQQPEEIVFHAPDIAPDKKRGGAFGVSCPEWGVLQKLSAAYAISHFGPHSHGPKSLKNVRFEGQLPDNVEQQIRLALAKIKGIAFER
ncbi:MAG: hypothetical protein AABW54_04750 [Candidatus Micrarchaeota archaeon]